MTLFIDKNGGTDAYRNCNVVGSVYYCCSELSAAGR